VSDAPTLVEFAPFDPAKKMSEATATDSTGNPERIVKGALRCGDRPRPAVADRVAAAKALEGQGFRVLPSRPDRRRDEVGRPHRAERSASPDSATLVSELRGLGVRTVMVTGDAPATAAIVAHAVGLDGATCPAGPIPELVRPDDFAVFAGVLPEDKYALVKAFQKGGHTVGMCGDGCQRRAGAPPGTNRNRSLDGDRRRQIGRWYGAD